MAEIYNEAGMSERELKKGVLRDVLRSWVSGQGSCSGYGTEEKKKLATSDLLGMVVLY